MPIVKYLIELPEKDRKKLSSIISKGQSPAKTILRANILLASDKNNPKHLTVSEIANALNTTTTAVQKVRTLYANHGLDKTINRKKRTTPPVPAKITGETEAKIIALACSTPPEGRTRWTLRLLSERIVELEIVDSISYVQVGRVLKKTNLSLT